ncbi:AbrB/MazE/SpoVT family DNA-binding domain-containing protein [Kurthia populi]|uniref:AbrB/MazE/SpoVT family DNA-binding domain-containing protein n=1 Tax=Kurthia populi TaxID=1562132 RepID=A0ABW5Y4E0_9BACL
MKSTGINRKIDELGRIVLPIELRRSLGLEVKDPVEIFTEEDRIILRKYAASNACVVTGEVSDENIMVAGKWFSPEGIKKILTVAEAAK